MKEYDIVVVLWKDHSAFVRSDFPHNPEQFINPTLSVGVVMKDTEKAIVLVNDIERYDDRDDVSGLIIFKSSILGLKKYGKIKLRKPRK